MEWINKSKIVIVGLGLIGGSYARALKRLGYHVCAVDNNPDTISYALDNDIIDEGIFDDAEDMLRDADCVILGLYPSLAVKWIENNQKYFKPGIKITDVTGVKSSVVYDIQKILRDDVEFIAAHPMAGREVSGVQNSDDRIFRDANFIVVPTDKNSEESIEWAKNLGRVLGFNRISVLSPKEHDEMIAFVSQLTHCIAVSLMNCNDDTNLCDYTGDSFRDLTRIARINENMWSELFFMNKGPLLEEMNIFIEEITNLKKLIENDDSEGLKEKMRTSTLRRARFDKR